MKNLFIMCVVIALALAETVSASGQTTALTLNDCMRYAISNSTKVRIQQAAIGDAQIDRRDAALALFTPQINAQTVAYYNFGRNIDPDRRSTRRRSRTTISAETSTRKPTCISRQRRSTTATAFLRATTSSTVSRR